VNLHPLAPFVGDLALVATEQALVFVIEGQGMSLHDPGALESQKQYEVVSSDSHEA
jgi:hypothetical protein